MSVVGGLFHVNLDSRHVPGCLSFLRLFFFVRNHSYIPYTLSLRISKVDLLGLKEKSAPRSRTLRLPPLPWTAGDVPRCTYIPQETAITLEKRILPLNAVLRGWTTNPRGPAWPSPREPSPLDVLRRARSSLSFLSPFLESESRTNFCFSSRLSPFRTLATSLFFPFLSAAPLSEAESSYAHEFTDERLGDRRGEPWRIFTGRTWFPVCVFQAFRYVAGVPHAVSLSSLSHACD